jgi:hypothetical protein
VDKIHDLADLSSGAVLARYPGYETSAEEQAELVEVASTVRQALRILLGVNQQGHDRIDWHGWLSNRQPHPLHPPRRYRPLQPPANRHRPLPLVAFVAGKPQTPKRLGRASGAATLAPVLPHKEQHP